MKTYTQKQYDSAKKRAYKKGKEEGERVMTWDKFKSRVKHDCDSISMDEVLENSNQVNSWKKWEQFDFDWSVVALVVVSLAVLIGMITYVPNF